VTGGDLTSTETRELGNPDWLFGLGGNARTRRLMMLMLFPALVFAAILRFDFVFDDNPVILDDPLVVRQFSIKEIFESEVRVADVALGYYRPLITLSYRLDRSLWGLNPAGYHFTNLLWHLLVTYLVYWLALRTTGRLEAAWAGAMLFAVLPAHTEALGWIQGRVDLISTAFTLLAFLALLHARDTVEPICWWWAALGGLAFLAALLAKESTATFPLAWAVWEVSGIRPGRRDNCGAGLASRFVPLCLAALAYWFLRWRAVGTSLSFFSMSLSPAAVRVLAIPSVLAEYGRILFIPDLTLNFHQTVKVAPSLTTLATGLAFVLTLGGGLVITWRWVRPLFPWLTWVPIMLLPPLLFILQARAPDTGFFTAERFLYLPSVGWCVLLGSLLAATFEGNKEIRRPCWGLITLAAMLVGYAGLTLIRLLPWASAVDLYTAMKAQKNLPTSVRVLVLNNLGEVYLERGDSSLAREEFQAALRLNPDYSFAHNNLGVLLIREGRPTDARRWLETAIRLDPKYTEAYGNLGTAYEAMGDLPSARQAFERGLRLAPDSAFLAKGLARLNAENVSPQNPQVGGSR
jgi:hypothetical protein